MGGGEDYLGGEAFVGHFNKLDDLKAPIAQFPYRRVVSNILGHLD